LEIWSQLRILVKRVGGWNHHCLQLAVNTAFYKEHNSEEGGLQMFAEVAQILAVLPTSSAACERVFSLLRLMFGKRQDRSLEDYIQAAVMLRDKLKMTEAPNATSSSMFLHLCFQ
jgi:hypothetical protein